VKEHFTAEALIVGTNPGKGKYTGDLGSFRCVTRAGVRFDVGTGLTGVQRKAPPASVGDVIEFKYTEEFEASGVPRFPIYLRARADVDASEFTAHL